MRAVEHVILQDARRRHTLRLGGVQQGSGRRRYGRREALFDARRGPLLRAGLYPHGARRVRPSTLPTYLPCSGRVTFTLVLLHLRGEAKGAHGFIVVDADFGPGERHVLGPRTVLVYPKAIRNCGGGTVARDRLTA